MLRIFLYDEFEKTWIESKPTAENNAIDIEYTSEVKTRKTTT